MDERLDRVIAQGMCLGVLELLRAAGIDEQDQREMVRRVWVSMAHSGQLGLAERIVAGDVLTDDQVITLVAVMLQELGAAIAHLRPLEVRLRHLVELGEIPSDAGPLRITRLSEVHYGYHLGLALPPGA